jgi:hypothetical protein|tara:strand:- start:332 stop:538 length:207 start_codon:yes stop_codon:yes gene_type:complete
MHATRESLVSKLLTPDGRKDFDLDLLLEHANCASRLAPNHPHFVKLVSLVVRMSGFPKSATHCLPPRS